MNKKVFLVIEEIYDGLFTSVEVIGAFSTLEKAEAFRSQKMLQKFGYATDEELNRTNDLIDAENAEAEEVMRKEIEKLQKQKQEVLDEAFEIPFDGKLTDQYTKRMSLYEKADELEKEIQSIHNKWFNSRKEHIGLTHFFSVKEEVVQ